MPHFKHYISYLLVALFSIGLLSGVLLSAHTAHAQAITCTPPCTGSQSCQATSDTSTVGTCVDEPAFTDTTDQTGPSSPAEGLGPTTAGSGLQNPLGSTSDLPSLLTKILEAVTAIGTVVITLMLVYCGFLFVVAQGNEEKIRDARSALLWTVIGALVLLGASVIGDVISATVQTL